MSATLAARAPFARWRPGRLLPAALRHRTPLGWLQLTHNRARLLAALAGVAFADILILMQLGFMGALTETSVMGHRAWNADILLMAADADHLDDIGSIPRRRLHQALSVEGVASATPVHVAELAWTDPATDERTRVKVWGVDPDAQAFTNPEIRAQAHLLKLPELALFDRLSRGSFEALLREVEAGGSARFEALGRRFLIEGLFSQGASFSTDGTLIVGDQTFFRFFPGRSATAPSLVFVEVAPGADPEAVAARITAALPKADTRALTKAQVMEEELTYQATKRPIGFVFSFGAVIGVIVGIVIVYQVLTTDVQDHLSEYATLKAMGYPHRFFLLVVFEEALILAVLGFLPGFATALLLYQVAAAGTGLPVTMTVARALFVLVLTVLMCAASGAIATRKLARAEPAELF